MKITEKLLLENYDGICNGGTKISIINGNQIYWDYRTDDGCVCSRDNAGYISLAYNRVGKVNLDMDMDNHANIAKIESDEQKLWGDEI